MQINTPESAERYDIGNLRPGTLNSKILLVGKEGSKNNYRLYLETSEQSWSAPRHRHNFDQIRMAIAGEVDYGKQTLPVGWVAYFPEYVHYGPQERGDATVTLNLQFGSASGNGFMSVRQRHAAFAELSAKGYFEKGAFTYIDEKGQRHRQDAYEALWEQVNGRKLVYGQPRYDGLIKMNPETFEWVPDSRSPGVSYKRLGTFTERNMSVQMIKVDQGATLTIGAQDSPQVLFLRSGQAKYDGRPLEKHAALGIEEGEGPVDIKGADAAEFLYIRLPSFNG